nr:unnamed protein product [Amyelois transitella]
MAPGHKAQMGADLSSSMSLLSEKGESGHDHFKWDSIKTFVYFAFAFSSSTFTFDMFSKIVDNIRLFDFILIQITIGMSYMFMDCFIRQYTRKLDFTQSLNPLLKGITYGAIIQSAMWALLHARDLADSFEYLAMILLARPFNACKAGTHKANECLDYIYITLACNIGKKTPMNSTSVHIYYTKSFTHNMQRGSTTKVFALAVVWISNFFFTTVSDETLLLISKISFLWRTWSTCFLAVVVSFSAQNMTTIVLGEIMNLNSPSSYGHSIDLVTHIYGIGNIGVYDFQMISPYTMVDNAVIIFTVIFTLMGILRSYIMRILYKLMLKCITVDLKQISYHYLLFGILPLAADFLNAHRLYLFVIYGNIMIATIAYLSTTTLAISKLLHREFRRLKNIYIVGILCFVGFATSVPLVLVSSTKVQGLAYGVHMTVLYVGGFKVALVMWIYGVKRFSKDIHFWLDFKPTKFWIVCWSIMPIILIGFLMHRILKLTGMTDFPEMLTAALWFGISIILIDIFQLRTITKYMVANHFVNAFRSSRNYGPPEQEDRERRRNFNETLRLRKCKHSCRVFDDTYDCNHMPLIFQIKERIQNIHRCRRRCPFIAVLPF